MKTLKDFLTEAVDINSALQEIVFIQDSGSMSNGKNKSLLKEFIEKDLDNPTLYSISGNGVKQIKSLKELKLDGPHFGASLLDECDKIISKIKHGQFYFIIDGIFNDDLFDKFNELGNNHPNQISIEVISNDIKHIEQKLKSKIKVFKL